MFKIILVLRTLPILLVLAQLAAGQNAASIATKVDALHVYSDSLRSIGLKNRLEARQWALLHGCPTRVKYSDGTIIELIKLWNSRPIYYSTSNLNAARTISTNELWSGGEANLSLSGSELIVGEWDGGGVLTTHVELDGRVTQSDVPEQISDHSTHVAGTILASGIDADARGMASSSSLRAYDWIDDAAEMADEAADGLLISNHSYGPLAGWVDRYCVDVNGNGVDDPEECLPAWFGDTSIDAAEDFKFGFYDGEAASWDQIALDAPFYLVVKSAGNDRNDVGPATGSTYWVFTGGAWVQDTGTRNTDGDYDCIAGSAVSKNVLTVGAVDDLVGGYNQADDVVMSSFSSWGPTDDGRIKPDVSANGVGLHSCTFDESDPSSNDSYASMSGTSMAAPSVSGSLALLQEHYQDEFNGESLTASALKALVIHTADEAGPADGPDYQFGWGLVNSRAAAEVITQSSLGTSQIRTEVLNNGTAFEVLARSDGNASLKATVVWADVPGTPVSNALDPDDRMLVNDLDLRVTRESDGEVYSPWRLDADSPESPATTGDNDVDNVEQVLIANPEPGTYTISIGHKGQLQGGTQAFSLVLTGASEPRQWTFLVFVNGDNNLDPMAVADINEMEAVGSSDAVNIVVQVDRSSSGDWSDTRRYYITQDENENQISSTRLDVNPQLGELDMGDPQTLVDFVNWGIENYPAEHYAVVIWDHGSGWYKAPQTPDYFAKAVSWDDQSGNNIGVANGELEGALAEIQATLGKKIELLGFDACLMQMWEVEDIAASYADVMVTSEHTEAGIGWAYDEFLDDLVQTPTMEAAALGTLIVDAAVDNGLATQSAVELADVAQLTSSVDMFGKKLHWASRHGYQSTIAGIRDVTQEFATPSHIDLWDFADRVARSNALPSCLRDAAAVVRSRVETALIHSRHSASFAGAHGIAIYYPESGYDLDYNNLAVASETHWDECIQNGDYTADLAVELGVERLIAAQQFQAPDRGFWTYNGSASVGITALAVRALVKAGLTYADQPVRRGMNFIVANNHGANQAFYNLWQTSQTYETALALMAMEDVQNQAGGTLDTYISWARNFLINGRNPQDGGWRYYSRYYPSDLSVSQWPALALYEGDYADQTLWDGVRDFAISRQKANGEFTYGSGYAQGGGAITGAGLWCLLFHRDIDYSNSRVQSGFNWLTSNWSVTSCPGYSHGGSYGYYYYYMYSLAKACDLSGQTLIGGHDWFQEISTQLVSLQSCDGSWPRYQGQSEYGDLPTVFALLALQTKAIPPNSKLVVTLHSNADLHLYGPGGVHTGLDYATATPTLFTGIPNSSFEYVGLDSIQVITVDPIEEGGAYGYRLHGTGSGPWELSIEAYQDDYLIAADTVSGQIEPGLDLGCEVIVTASGGNLLVFPCEPDTLPCVATSPAKLAHTAASGDTLSGHFFIKEACGAKTIAGVNLIAHSLKETSSAAAIPSTAITLSPAHFDSIRAGDSVQVSYRLVVPANAPNGHYLGAIGIETFNALNQGLVVDLRLGLGGVFVSVESNGDAIAGVPVSILDMQGQVLYTGYTGYDGSARDSVSGGYYVVSIVPPLGYFEPQLETEKLAIVTPGIEDTVRFELQRMAITPSQWTAAYWRHMIAQVKEGHMYPEVASLRSLLPRYVDAIYAHFQNHPVHPIPIFSIPNPGDAAGKIDLIYSVLSSSDKLRGDQIDKAVPDVYGGNNGRWTVSCQTRGMQELAALLLNLASMKLATFSVATIDSMDVGQVATYASDCLMNDEVADNCAAATALYYLNLGIPIGEGVIPASTPIVVYMQTNGASPTLPTVFALEQNHPNPFNARTDITYSLPQACAVRLQIYNVMGQLVRSLIDSPQKPGVYTVSWDGCDVSGRSVASGIYFYRLSAGDFSKTKKMVLLK